APALTGKSPHPSFANHYDPHVTKKPRDHRPWFPAFSSTSHDQMFSIFPAIEERGCFGQLFLQVLRLADGSGSALRVFVALLLSAFQQRLNRFDGGARSLL